MRDHQASVSGVESVAYGDFKFELLAHEQQQIHLSKAEMGCQHAPRTTFSAKKDMQISRS